MPRDDTAGVSGSAAFYDFVETGAVPAATIDHVSHPRTARPRRRQHPPPVPRRWSDSNVFNETTVRYPPDAIPVAIDDEAATLPVDAREMNTTAQASLFIDSARIKLR